MNSMILVYLLVFIPFVLGQTLDIIKSKDSNLTDLEVTNITQLLSPQIPTTNIQILSVDSSNSSLILRNIMCGQINSTVVIVIYNDLTMLNMARHLTMEGFIVFTIPEDYYDSLLTQSQDLDSGLSMTSISLNIQKTFPSGSWAETIVLTDGSYDIKVLQKYVTKNSAQKIRTRIFQFSMSQIVALETFFSQYIKKKVRHIVVFTKHGNIITDILKSAKKMQILQQNYFWVLVSPSINENDVLSVLTSKDIPNIMYLLPEGFINFNSICGSTWCKSKPLYANMYWVMNYAANISTYISQNLLYNNTLSLCRDSFTRTQVQSLYTAYKGLVINGITQSLFLGNTRNWLTHSTKSIDLDRNVPNQWRYSTTFITTSRIISATNQIISFNRVVLKEAKRFKAAEIYPNLFQGWDNKVIYLCSPPLTPSLNFLSDEKYLSLNKTKGVITEMLLVLGEAMNFRPYVYEADDKLWGAPIRGSPVLNYTGCVGDIFNGKSLFGAAVFTPNADRKKGIDFSVLYMDESNCAALQFPKPGTKIWHVYRPLQWAVWLLLLGTIVVASLKCYVFSIFSPLSAWNLKLPFSIRDEVRIREHFWNVIGSFMMQGQDFYPYAMSARMVLAIWWIFTLIIFSAYTADLTSFLTVKGELTTLKTLDELANRTDLKIVIPADTIAAAAIEKSDYWAYQKIQSRVSYIKTIDECPRMILSENASNLVCITDTSPVLYVQKRNCDKIYIIPQTFNTAPMGFAIQNDAPFLELLNVYIRKMMDMGQMEKWINKFWSNSDPNTASCGGSSSGSQDAPAIDLEGVGGVFICTAVLIVAAFFMLGIEVFWVRVLGKPTESFCWQA